MDLTVSPAATPRARLALGAVFAALLAIARSASSAWTFDPGTGVPVCDTVGNQTQAAAASDGAGGAIVGWIDTRNTVPDVYALRLTHDGVVAPGWPADGMTLCAAASIQTGLRMIEDGAGGAILVWIDFRAGAADVYAQRVTGAGTIAGGWPANGVAVCTAPGSQSNPVLVADGAHGAIVVWQDSRSGTSIDVYGQHVLAAGSLDPAWPAAGREICVAQADQVFPAIAALPGGGAIVAWEDGRGVDPDVFAQKLDAAGHSLWAIDGIPVCTASLTQSQPQVAADGSGGAYFAWNDYRQSSRTAAYAQHLMSNGATAPFWSFTGNALGIAAAKSRDPVLLSDGGGGVFAAWVDARSGSDDVYMTDLDAFGAAKGSWMDGGTAICAAAGRQDSPRLALDGAGGVVAAWRDARNDSLYDVFGLRLTGDGIRASGWTADGLPVGNAPGAQSEPALVSSAGSAIAAWADLRNKVHWDVYANRIGPEAVLAAPAPGGGTLALAPVVPNPVHGGVTLRFRLERGAPVSLAVFDVSGRRVARVLQGTQAAGSHVVRWNGRGERGESLPAGRYVARLVGPDGAAATSFVMLR